MFHTTRVKPYRLTILAGLFLATASAMAASTAPAADLGKSWPSAQDVSASPQWHVYVFQRDGVEYVQANDTLGNVHAVFATAHGQTLILPAGDDSQRVVVLPQPNVAAGLSETVYRDDRVQLVVVPQASGFGWVVYTLPTTDQPAPISKGATQPIAQCSGRECTGNDSVKALPTTTTQAADAVNTPTKCQGRECTGNDIISPLSATASQAATQATASSAACSGRECTGNDQPQL